MLRLTLCLIGVRIALTLTTEDAAWRRNVDNALLIALIASVAWLAVAIMMIIEALMLTHYSVDVADNRRARRLRTQMILSPPSSTSLPASNLPSPTPCAWTTSWWCRRNGAGSKKSR